LRKSRENGLFFVLIAAFGGVEKKYGEKVRKKLKNKQKKFKKPLVFSDDVIYNKGTKGGKRWLKGKI
jgi:hypothetical protein